MAKKLSEQELEAILSHQIALAKDHYGDTREKPISRALDYYQGHMDEYVPPEANRSKVVSRDVADTVGVLMPGIMRVFASTNRMFVAEPDEGDANEFADEITDGLNHVFWKDNRGYGTIYDATWDALVTKKAIVKTYYDDTPVYSTSFHSGLTEDQVALLVQDEDTEVLAQTATEEMVPDEMGQPVPVTVYDLKVKRLKRPGKFVVEAIPPEEFLIDGDAVYTDEAAFTAHWQKVTRSELVQMGYDKDEVAAIPEAGQNDTEEAIARNNDMNEEANDASMEKVDYFECYIRVDVDGDGEAELVRACYGGGSNGKLLDWEVWEDEHPFDDIPCEPIPHRWDARSVADETMDIQDIKTVLSRQFLSNTYWVNNPLLIAQGKIKNPDMLVNPTFGGVVFGDATATVQPVPIPYIGDKALMALTHFDEVRQARTGVGRQSMALDPDVLQNQTATASNNNKDAAHSQEELLARNMAEFGWVKVGRKLMRLMIKHQDYARQIMVKKKPVEFDPRHWNADTRVTVNVGLGTGSRDRDIMMLQQTLSNQIALADRFVALGAMDDAIDLLPMIIETMTKIAEAAGIRDPEEYYPEYAEEQVAKLKQMAAEKAQQPNPEVMKEQAKIEAQKELKMVDVQTDMQKEELKARGNAAKEQAQLEADLQTKEADRQNALVIEQNKQAFEREKMEREFSYRMWEANQKFQLEREKMAHADMMASRKAEQQPAQPN